MCGIAGIFNSETKAVRGLDELVKDLLIMTQVRGMDSTGILNVNGQWEMEAHKKAVNASDFISLPRTKAMLADVDTNFTTILHCRKKTLGTSGHAAAHPFLWDDEQGTPEFGMVHNGTLTQWTSANFESDSHWLSKQMYENTEGALEKLRGAAALLWADQRTATNNFFTNGERPLFYGFLKKEKVLIVGSEAELMYAALTRNNFELRDDQFIKATPGWIYEFDMGDVDKWECKEVKKPVTVIPPRRNYGNQYTDDYGWPRDEKKDEVAVALEKLFAEATGTSLPAATKPTIRAVSFNPTEEEKAELYNFSGTHKIEVMASIDFYDEKNQDLYLSITDMLDYAKAVVIKDVVIMRDVNPEYYKFINATFEQLCVCIGGMVVGNSLPEFIVSGRHIVSSCKKKTAASRQLALVN